MTNHVTEEQQLSVFDNHRRRKKERALQVPVPPSPAIHSFGRRRRGLVRSIFTTRLGMMNEPALLVTISQQHSNGNESEMISCIVRWDQDWSPNSHIQTRYSANIEMSLRSLAGGQDKTRQGKTRRDKRRHDCYNIKMSFVCRVIRQL